MGPKMGDIHQSWMRLPELPYSRKYSQNTDTPSDESNFESI